MNQHNRTSATAHTEPDPDPQNKIHGTRPGPWTAGGPTWFSGQTNSVQLLIFFHGTIRDQTTHRFEFVDEYHVTRHNISEDRILQEQKSKYVRMCTVESVRTLFWSEKVV